MTDVLDVVCPKCEATGRVRLDVLRSPIRCKRCGARIVFADNDEMHAGLCEAVAHVSGLTTIDQLTEAIDVMKHGEWQPTLRRLVEERLLAVLRAKTFDTFLGWADYKIWRGGYDATAMFARVTDPRYRDALVEELVARLCQVDKPHARAVLRSLRALGWRPTSVLERAHVLIARKRYDEAAKLGPEAVELLTRLIRYEPVNHFTNETMPIRHNWLVATALARVGVVAPILRLCQTPSDAGVAVKALTLALTDHTSRIPTEDLSRLARVRDVPETKWREKEWGDTGLIDYFADGDEIVSCEAVRRAAAHELERRGIVG